MIAGVVVHCDACRTERSVLASTVKAGRAVLRARGWKHVTQNRRSVDWCPSCSEPGALRGAR